MIWDVSPEIVHLGPVTIRWYGLFFAISFLLGYEIMRYIFRKEHKPERNLSALLFVMMAGTVIGARLGHTLFYEPGFYLSNPLEILKAMAAAGYNTVTLDQEYGGAARSYRHAVTVFEEVS